MVKKQKEENKMSKVDEITRDSWIMSTFPEWGTWLNEEIENEEVKPGTVAMWWLGCTGIWFKTPGGANITIDLWAGNGKRTHGDGKMKVGHQIPPPVKQVDAVLATHYHQDHMSAEYASHVLKSGMTTVDENGNEIPVPFIGPKKSVEYGKDYDIDVAFGSYGENPVGMQDKMTSVDILRMAEALRTDVVIPIHYDVWTNFKADPKRN